MAPKLGYKASSLAPMMSNGKTLVENNATLQKVAQFDRKVKAGKVSTEGRAQSAYRVGFFREVPSQARKLAGGDTQKGRRFRTYR